MNKKNIIILLIIVSLITISCSNVGSLEIKNLTKTSTMDQADKPDWSNGNYWTYDMNFIFISRNDKEKIQFKVDADISDMTALVTSTKQIDGEETYILSLNGDLTGNVNLLDKFDVAEIKADYGGEAYISVDTLGIKKFNFNVEGQVDIPVLGWRDIRFNMIMKFEPSFDFFGFPIKTGESPWTFKIQEATLQANVWIDAFGGYSKDYSNTTSFDDNMVLHRTEQLIIPQVGTFDTYVIGGDWGKESNLWYAPTAGYLIQVDETLVWKGGAIEAEFNLLLKGTNFDPSNHPPDKPVISGDQAGDTGEELEYHATTYDQESESIYYWFDWDDGTNSGWLGPYDNNVECTASHAWSEKGVFNVMVKAKDTNDFVSPWSEPYPVTILGAPHLTITINRIEALDDLDVLSDPELYYKLTVVNGDKEQFFKEFNTDNGEENGNWISSKTWEPNIEHIFEIENKNPVVRIKVMDHDLVDGDDLADVSGSNNPDNDGKDDDTSYKRGAIYHGTFDMGAGEFKPFSTYPDDFSDKLEGSYVTSGDFIPDSSTEHEGGALPDPENDAKVSFSVSSDYVKPTVDAEIVDQPDIIRTGTNLQFKGSVKDGAPGYYWTWDFGDGTTENIQNPTHMYSEIGTYTIDLTVTDSFDQKSSTTIQIVVTNNEKPTNLKISGPSKGNAGEIYSYKFSASDLENDQLYYRINWGDNTKTEWLGPYVSGAEITEKHSWSDKDSYTIEFEAKDEYGATNSKTLTVSMPKQLTSIQNIFEKILLNLRTLINQFF